MKLKPQILILAGDGINCEHETAKAFDLAGGRAQIVHINDLLNKTFNLNDFHGLAIPGGFSFGDDLGSGKVLALKIKYQLGESLNKFIQARRPIIGICNGFQVLTKLGLLPFVQKKSPVLLSANKSGCFINKWVKLAVVEESRCIWTMGPHQLTNIELPIRHGEGRVTFPHGDIYPKLKEKKLIALTYESDVNGSAYNIAGLCDQTGLIFGLMPHPEAYLYEYLHPTKSQGNNRFNDGSGLAMFKNAIDFINQS